uniref:Uncharacterized protein n=1 Tax=Anguilla anguilla TaxID=7936 RepID=A0A0E9SNS3_ANGAN
MLNKMVAILQLIFFTTPINMIV